MADFTEELIEDFIENLMEVFNKGFAIQMIEVLMEHGLENLVEDFI